MSKFFLILACIFAHASAHAQYKIVHAFNLVENPAIIEGMSYDPVGKHFYFGESTTKRMLRYTLAGKPAGYIDGAKDGMTSVLGSTVDIQHHHLWVCGATDTGSKQRMCVFQYDLENGRLLKKLPDTSGKAKLFNDVTIANGNVYVTDTYTKAIYISDEAKSVMTTFIQNDLVRDPNGITSHSDTIYVSTSRGIVAINVNDKKITPLSLQHFMIAGIDGLYYYDQSVVGIQNVLYPVSVVRYFIDNNQNKLSRAVVLASGPNSLVIPTTGAIVGDDFYFMSNNNIGNEDLLKTADAGSKKLKPVSMVKIALNNVKKD